MIQYFSTRLVDGTLLVDGLPDAVKVVSINTKRVERLAHLALHRSDLQFASECLQAMSGREEDIIRDSLWRSASSTTSNASIAARGAPSLMPEQSIAGKMLVQCRRFPISMM